jgi:NADPH:quinone reductase-like Zn-dependent oxidoreductase
MKALLLSRCKHLEIADLPDPTPRQGEVLVSVAG